MTDTNQAGELFKLCKEVYELTGWNDTQNGYYFVDGEQPLLYNKDNFHISKEPWWRHMAYLSPAYTSDYLLEKLPSPLIFDENDCAIEVRRTKKDKYMWSANIRHSYGQYFKQIADTPLKALLKLTIALSEAGELNGQSS